MADNSVTRLSREGLLQGILSAFPEGSNKEPGSGVYETAELLTRSTSLFIDRLETIQAELNPQTAEELIDMWIDLVSRFDDCFEIPEELQAKRDAVVAKLRASPNQGTTTAILAVLRLLFGNNVTLEVQSEQTETPFHTGAVTQGVNNVLIGNLSTAQGELALCVARKTLPVWVGIYVSTLDSAVDAVLDYIRIVNVELPAIFR